MISDGEARQGEKSSPIYKYIFHLLILTVVLLIILQVFNDNCDKKLTDNNNYSNNISILYLLCPILSAYRSFFSRIRFIINT